MDKEKVAEITSADGVISEILGENQSAFLDQWMAAIRSSKAARANISEAKMLQQCSQVFRSLREGFRDDSHPGSRWNELRQLLADITRTSAIEGASPMEAASFILLFKQPLFRRMRDKIQEPEQLAAQIWYATELLDSFGLYATELWLSSREELIRRQQEEMLELSTPVIKLWNGILALPLVGTLDSARTQVVMESLLEAIVRTNSRVAILDITGVPTVDTVVAQHLLKTVTAARLMGADCIISGIRPQIAQTIVHLGINLLDITTKATLRDAFAEALDRTGQTLTVDREA